MKTFAPILSDTVSKAIKGYIREPLFPRRPIVSVWIKVLRPRRRLDKATTTLIIAKEPSLAVTLEQFGNVPGKDVSTNDVTLYVNAHFQGKREL